MLSVGSRDGRREPALGFGAGVGEMDDAELEEGEASYYHDDDARVDPDTDFSYLDDKLQEVLGHFQKDFEGGVSAENLGAKFGGYGSFLPSYQRSPSILSRPRSPPQPQNSITQRSPTNLSLENGRLQNAVPVSEPRSRRFVPCPTIVQSVPSQDVNSIKRDRGITNAPGIGENSPKHEFLGKPPLVSDQKTMKVRLKMVPDNALAKKNTAIYTGLGLDISPSSSLKDSHDGSADLSPSLSVAPEESPMAIIQIMTSFPIAGGHFLSPLHESLLYLPEKENLLLKENSPGTGRKGRHKVSVLPSVEFQSLRGDNKRPGEKKVRSANKNGMASLLKVDIDIETPEGKELVYNALKLPILSESKYVIERSNGGMLKDVPNDTYMEMSKEYSSMDEKDNQLDLIAPRGPSKNDDLLPLKGKTKSKESTGDRAWEERRTGSHKDSLVDQRIDGKISDLLPADADVVKGRKNLSAVSGEPPRKRAAQDAVMIAQGKEQLVQGKIKTKGSQLCGTPGVEPLQEGLKLVPTIPSKERKKGVQAKDNVHESKGSQTKHQKELSKLSRESNQDYFGDLRCEGVGYRADLVDTASAIKPKDQKVEDHAEKSKDKFNSKKLTNLATSEALAKRPTDEVVCGNAPNSEAGALPTAAPVVIEEHWVCCDRCQKWRLLPYEWDPGLLPKKWHCSMLTWLPGMNKCSISEEETTKALNALYQMPLPENHNLPSQQEGITSGAASGNLQVHHQNHEQNIHLGASGKKKKHPSSKDSANAASRSNLTHLSNSIKKNQQATVKSKSINDVNLSSMESNLANGPNVQVKGKSTDTNAEKSKQKLKENHKLVEQSVDEGYHHEQKGRQSKSKSKKESDPDWFRTSKKAKMERSQCSVDDWHSGPELCGTSLMGNGLLSKSTRKNLQKHSAKDLKVNTKGILSSSGKTPSVEVFEDECNIHIVPSDIHKSNPTKKRKVKEWQESQVYLETLPDVNYNLENEVFIKEEMSGSERTKEKKVKISKSEGKKNKVDQADNIGRVTKVLQAGERHSLIDTLEMDKRSFDCTDSLRKDLGYKTESSMAATSSSSKVSGSRKSKANLQEVKGSPVESVSSSPLRVFVSDKLTGSRRVPLRKDDVANAFSDGEDGGFDPLGKVKKEEEFAIRRNCTSQGTKRAAESLALDYVQGHYDEYQGSEYSSQISGRRSKDELPSKRSGGIESEAFPPDQGNVNVVNDWPVTSTYASTNFSVRDPQNKNRDCSHQDNLNQPSNNGCDNWAAESKSAKGSISHFRDKNQIGDGKGKVSDSSSDQGELFKGNEPCRYGADIESHDLSPCLEDLRKTVKSNLTYVAKKGSSAKLLSESRKDNCLKVGENSDVVASPPLTKHQTDNSKNGKPNMQSSQIMPQGEERSAYERTDRAEKGSGRVKSVLSGSKQEIQSQPLHQGVPTPSKSSRFDADASICDALESQKHQKKADTHNATHMNVPRHLTSNGISGREFDAPSPVRKDHSQLASNAIKEAKDLKHTADRIKNAGQEVESVTLYFQAALKFLYGASLLEHVHVESAKHGEITQSMQVYSDTAKLCEYCAHEYERQRDMAAACLAYKCMELAYMRVVYFKNFSACKDRQELQATLQMAPPGESPSSSASDVDNVNNQAIVDKAGTAKALGSQIAGNHVIVARNRPNFVRLLNFAQDINSAMEALRRSQNAFVAANTSSENSKHGNERISSVRTVLEFNVHDVDSMLHLVRVAMESIHR